MEYFPILMTASVSTRGMKGACFSDEERFNMYLGALTFYIKYFLIDRKTDLDIKIVFVDNSGWDLSTFRNILTEQFDNGLIFDNVEFISISTEIFDITKGKGYNELLMINHAVKKSKFISQAGYFFKVTGRYPIYNLANFIKDADKKRQQGCRFYCDIKNHNLYKNLGLDWCSHSFEARLWGSETGFYECNIGNHYEECNDYDGRFVEAIVYEKLAYITNNFMNTNNLTIIGGGNLHVRFPREPRFGGLEGSDSNANSFSKNQQSLKSRCKILLGNFFRIFTPWFKF